LSWPIRIKQNSRWGKTEGGEAIASKFLSLKIKKTKKQRRTLREKTSTHLLCFNRRKMAAKKRKASNRQSSAKKNDSGLQSKFNANETFDNSEDEFIAGRDQILLEEGPEAKRRRKFQEEGRTLCPRNIAILFLPSYIQTPISNPPTKKFLDMTKMTWMRMTIEMKTRKKKTIINTLNQGNHNSPDQTRNLRQAPAKRKMKDSKPGVPREKITIMPTRLKQRQMRWRKRMKQNGYNRNI
jgi:hypothetical protein